MIKCRLTFVDNTKGQKELEETIGQQPTTLKG